MERATEGKEREKEAAWKWGVCVIGFWGIDAPE